MTRASSPKSRKAFTPTRFMARDWNPSLEDQVRLLEIEELRDLSREEGGPSHNERRRLRREEWRILRRSYGRDARFLATGDPTGMTPITGETRNSYDFYRTIIEIKELTDAALMEMEGWKNERSVAKR